MGLAGRGKKQISGLKSALPNGQFGSPRCASLAQKLHATRNQIIYAKQSMPRSMPKPITSFGRDSVVVPCANCCAL
jgi:hypothetical protein